MFISASLLLTAFAAVPLPQGPSPLGESELQTKSYHLPIPARHRPASTLALVPYRRSDDQGGVEEENLIEGGQILDLIRSVLHPDRWEEPGYALQISQDARLLVTASPEMHTDIVRMLEFLDSNLGRTQDLAVEVYPISAGAQIPHEVGGVMTSAATQRFIEELGASKALGTPRAWTVRAMPMNFSAGGGHTSHRLIVDCDVEIAQAAAIADPISDTLRIGTSTMMRANSANGGVFVQLLFSHANLLSPISSKEVSVYRELVHMETGGFDRAVMKYEFNHPRVAFASSAATLFLPNGSELLQVYRSKGPWGESGRLLRVRALARSESANVLTFGDRSIAIRDLSAALQWEEEFGIGSALLTPDRGNRGELSTHLLAGSPHIEELLENVRSQLAEADWDNGLDLNALGGCAVVLGPSAAVTAIDAKIKAALEGMQSTDNLLVLLQDRAGQETYASVALSTAPDRSCYFSVGSDTLIVADYDVEVAQASSVTDPVVIPVGNGIVGSIRTARQGDSLRIELDAVLHVMAGDIEFSTMNAWIDTPIERYHGASAHLGESFDLGAGESVRVGDLDPESKSGLMLTIRRR